MPVNTVKEYSSSGYKIVMTSGKKNIIIIGPAHPLRGGLASFNERLALECKNSGHQVSIYTFSLQYPGFLFPGTTQYSSEPAPPGLDIQVLINSVNPFNWIKTGRKLQKEKPDIILVRYWLPFMGPCLGTILRIVHKNKHTRIVCLADNIIPHEKRPGDVVFTRYFLKPVDAFVTMSEKVLSQLSRFAAGKPARYVAHPLYDNFGEKISRETARAHLHINPNEKVVLFFGFIRKYKGLDILLEAIKILKQSTHKPFAAQIKFLIAGEFYEDRAPYDDMIRSLGIESSLILHTEFISDSEVKNYLCASDLVVQPYKSATQSGVTPLAYHFEVPMVVTNVGGLPAMVPDDKVGLIAAPNAASVAEKIIEYFEKGEEHFLPYLREEKKKYSWKIMLDTILSV